MQNQTRDMEILNTLPPRSLERRSNPVKILRSNKRSYRKGACRERQLPPVDILVTVSVADVLFARDHRDVPFIRRHPGRRSGLLDGILVYAEIAGRVPS